MLSIALLKFYKARTGIAVLGLGAAVLLVLLLTGLWHGISLQGTQAIEATNRDLWMSGNPSITLGSIGVVENQLLNAHEVASEVEHTTGVKGAEAMSFQSVYLSADGSEFSSVVAVGITGTSAPLVIIEGHGFEHRDVHYANGSYDGPMTNEIIIDQRLATGLNISIGDHLNVGGTIASANQHQFKVVGISTTFSSFIGTTTVILHLSELQSITRTTTSDSASLIAITLEDNADQRTVIERLEAKYPEHAVRTNSQQFQAILRQQAPVMASAAAIAIIGIFIGVILVLNTLARVVYAQQTEFAALQAIGISRELLFGTVFFQGISIGSIGGVLGIITTALVSEFMNEVIASLVGYRTLIVPTGRIYLLGFVSAIAIGCIGAGLAIWQISRSRLKRLNYDPY